MKEKQLIVSWMITAASNYITDDQAKRAKEVIEMTRLGAMFEKDKQKAVEEAIEKATKDKQKAVEEAIEKATKDKQKAVEKAVKEAVDAERKVWTDEKVRYATEIVDKLLAVEHLSYERIADIAGATLDFVLERAEQKTA